ncbi:DNA-directed RNA polymerase III subunit RPC7 isoform X2 [Pseudophryne corroboree]
MAGKARGRGASFTFDLQAIGFSRGDSLPETAVQPLPLFPHTDHKPVPLLESEEQEYLLALKQELRGTMKRLPYFIGKESKKQSIERYITKYETEAQKKLSEEWTPDWRMLPREMKATKNTKKRVKKAKVVKPSSSVDVIKKIEELEKKGDNEKSDEENESTEKKKEGDDEEEEAELEAEDEEEQEEENDYIASYFEDGDDFGNSDDNMDEATY